MNRNYKLLDGRAKSFSSVQFRPATILVCIKEDKDWNLCNTKETVQALTEVNCLS